MSKRILSFFPINSASGKMESLEDFFDSKQMIWKLFGLPFLEGQTTRSRRLPINTFLWIVSQFRPMNLQHKYV